MNTLMKTSNGFNLFWRLILFLLSFSTTWYEFADFFLFYFSNFLTISQNLSVKLFCVMLQKFCFIEEHLFI